MRVKRFVASTIQEAMNKMKSEMGKDAIILHTRKVKDGGIFGFFTKEMFEVTGAIENVSLPKVKTHTESLASNPKSGLTSYVAPDTHSIPVPNGIKSELHQMKSMMHKILDRMNNESNTVLPADLQAAEQRLISNDVEQPIARMIVQQIFEAYGQHTAWDPEMVKKNVIERIEALIGQPKPIVISGENKQQEVIVLVGPTGVGKTTTIAKLAATFSIIDKKKVGLITADTYRIAAVEQLKTFGEIIGVPVEVVFTSQALRTAIERNHDRELLLIDTAGRSHKNDQQVEELKALIEVSQPSQSILVLSATTKYSDLLQIVECFSSLNINRCLFTKLDETYQLGSILNIVYGSGKSLSYITTGQNVPDDIEIADPRKLANLIYGETGL